MYYLTRLRWQFAMAAIPVGGIALCVLFPEYSGVSLGTLDRASFISVMSALATIVALLCYLSVAWILFVSQQNKTLRVAAYDTLKGCLLTTQQWLLTQPDTVDRTVCLEFIYQMGKLDLSDLPQTDRGDAYRAYCASLEEGLESNDRVRREFFLVSSTHVIYIEHLLNRIGLLAVRQILAKSFLDTLAKGVVLVGISVVALSISTLWFNETIKPFLVFISGFCGIASVLLLIEVLVDLRRDYDEDLDFVADSELTD
jgi:hypothetical protein